MLVPGMLEEIHYGLNSVFGSGVGNEWKKVNLYRMVASLAGRVATRSLVGADLARDPAWLECAIGYTGDVFAVAQDLRNRHWLIRPFVFALSNYRRRLWNRINTARKRLTPLLRERGLRSDDKTPEDMLKWITASAVGADKAFYRLSDKILFLWLASIHTSTSTAVQALFNLCAFQREVSRELEAEVREIVGQHGGLTLPAINKMKKLDSLLRETQRLNYPGTLSFNRRVIQKITLSDGMILTPRTFITVPAAMTAQDPRVYEEAEKFKPWRFAHLRDSAPSEANKHQFTSTSADPPAFGLGKFACPGRFFAAALIKQLITTLLMEFEFRFPDGQTERPKNHFTDERIAPDARQNMEFRRKATPESWT